MEYYSAINKNKTLPYETRWMNLESIMITEASYIEKDKYHRNSLTYGSKESSFRQNRLMVVSCGRWRWEKCVNCFLDLIFSLNELNKTLKKKKQLQT